MRRGVLCHRYGVEPDKNLPSLEAIPINRDCRMMGSRRAPLARAEVAGLRRGPDARVSHALESGLALPTSQQGELKC